MLSEGLLALLAAAVLRYDRCNRRTAAMVTALLAAVYASLAGASHPRRVGDGHEYVVMARQFATASPPAPSPSDLEARADDISRLRGFSGVHLREADLIGSDGRQDFRHFWLYSLAVSPVLAVVAAMDVHWNHAFTVVNIALLAALAYFALLELPTGMAVVLLAGPVIWWIDKAQIEVFNVSLVGLAFVVHRRLPGPSLLALGAVTAQNPAFALLLCPMAIATIVRSPVGGRIRACAFAAASLALAAVGPGYYLLHLGRLSPLQQTAIFYWPTPTAILTPLVDPFVGFLWHYPGLVIVVVLALTSATLARFRDADVVVAVSCAAALLVLFAMTVNVNHGGTPGPSRYGVWLVPFAIPILLATEPLTGWRRAVVPFVALASMLHAVLAFHPRLGERTVEPSSGAAWITERWPSMYDPLPEVFAERYGGADGSAVLPIASAGCGKVLLAGDGHASGRWPIPCVPVAPPPECVTPGALCYANRRLQGGYAFSVAPRQPSFGFETGSDTVWRDVRDLGWMPAQPHWGRLERVTPFSPRSYVRTGRDLVRVDAFQHDGELIAFVRAAPLGSPAICIRADFVSDLWVLRRSRPRTRQRHPVAGDAWVPLPNAEGTTVVLLVNRR